MKKPKSLKKVIIVLSLLMLGILSTILLINHFRSLKNSNIKEHELVHKAAEGIAFSIDSEINSLYQENALLIEQNNWYFYDYSYSNETAQDYENRVKGKIKCKMNKHWFESARKAYDEAFDLYSHGEFEKSLLRSQNIDTPLRELRNINYFLKHLKQD